MPAEKFERRIAELIAAKAAEPTTELARWVALSPVGLRPMSFDMSEQTAALNPRTVRIEEATRFGSSKAARLIARHIHGPDGTSGKPVRLDHAYDYLRCCLERKLADVVRPTTSSDQAAAYQAEAR